MMTQTPQPYGTAQEDKQEELASLLIREQAARAEAEAAHQRLHDLFMQTPALICVLRGPQHIFELANPPYLQLVGHRNIIGKTIGEALPALISQGFSELLDHVYATGTPFIDQEVKVVIDRYNDGRQEEGYFNFAYQPWRNQAGEINGILVHAVEVTEQVQARESVKNLNANLETTVVQRTAVLRQLNTELQRSNQELQDFAYVASHDLQEPLRKIQAFGNLLEEEYGQALGEGKAYLDRMRNASARMRTLINDLLTFSRVASKTLPFSPIDLTAIAYEVADDLEAQIQVTQGTVEIGTLPIIEADPLQMRQMLQNLMGNALKFHHPGRPPALKLYAELQPDPEALQEPIEQRCMLFVQDNGIGFDEKYLDRIFTVFQRLHGKKDYEGTGIGLAVVRKIVERHQGTITAHSAVGEGTTFIITLPVQHTEKEVVC